MLKTINTVTDEQPHQDYFDLLRTALGALNTSGSSIERTMLWYYARLLWIDGHTPNVAINNKGEPLVATSKYNFDFSMMCFEPSERGTYNALHIKLLRISIAQEPRLLEQIQITKAVLDESLQLIKQIYQFQFSR